MKLLSLLLLIVSFIGKGQEITGKWTTIDDNSGREKSVVDIYERDGKIYGKIVRIFPVQGDDLDPVCDKCPSDDARYNKKIIGMEILKDMEKSGDSFSDGNILDPEIGKIYRCKVWLEGKELQVRGYWGPFFRTQTWRRTQ